jgi:prepilin peptidase CpaA
MAVINDLHNYKVRNEITFTFAVVGIVYNALALNSQLLYSSLLGMLLPFILLLPLYVLKMLGAGDIKLFCSMGALIGGTDILFAIAYSFLAGGFVVLMLMVIRKNFRSSIRYFYNYIKSCILSLSFLSYDDMQSVSNRKIHFTLCIALGTVIFYLI